MHDGPVLVGRLGQRRPAAPAPDEVQQAVDAAEAQRDRRRPALGAAWVEQVDGVRVHPIGRELVDQALDVLGAAVGQRDARPGRHQRPRDVWTQRPARAGDRVGPAFQGGHAGTATRSMTGAIFVRSDE